MSTHKKPSATVPKLRDILTRFLVETSTGHHHAVIGEKLDQALTTKAWDAAPEFFAYTLIAHFDAATLGLTRLFDSTGGVLSMEALIKAVEREAGSFAQMSASEVRATMIPHIRKEIIALKPRIAPLTKKRNELLGGRRKPICPCSLVAFLPDELAHLIRAI